MTDLEAAVQLLGGETNKVIYDDVGLPSIMVRFDKKMVSELVDDYVIDVVHPAFVVNNTELDNFYVSKYENVIINDRAYSLPLQEPNITSLENAKNVCTKKGKGWHIMSLSERSFISMFCANNKFIPSGNNSKGENYSRKYEKGIISTTDGKVLTGSGPKSWAHNNNVSGVWDIVGNVADWVNGIRFCNNEVQIVNNNDCADFNNNTDETSTLWKAINSQGALIEPNGLGTTDGSIKYNYVNSILKVDTSVLSSTGGECQFSKINSNNINIPQLLKLLGLYPFKNIDYDNSFFTVASTSSSSSIYRYTAAGGHNISLAKSGLNQLYNGYIKSHNMGIRSAYVEI